MEHLRIHVDRFQNVVLQLYLIGSLILTLTLTQVLTPQDAKAILKKHNEYRRQESASDMYLMHWNVSLQQRADAWAQRCLFKHERNLDLGENLYFDTDHRNDVFARGLEEWHKEKSKWGYTSGGCAGSCHFTQIVWGYTTTVGCSAHVCPSINVAGRNIKDALYFVCYYYPRGNFIGNFPYSRGHPCSECAAGDTCSDGLCVSSGPDSKSAPDFVKSLAPQAPLSLSRASHSFQAFNSLIQHFKSEASHDTQGHRQQTHHRSEQHEHQQHHYQSETMVSGRSASHSYSSQQQHHQVYHHSSQQHHQRVENSQQEHEVLREQARQQMERKRQETLEYERQQREEDEKRRQALIDEQQKQMLSEQRRQHLEVQKRFQEEHNLHLEKLRKQEEDRQKLLRIVDLSRQQLEEERRRKQAEEQSKEDQRRRLQEESLVQKSQYDLSRVPGSSKDSPDREKIESISISLQKPSDSFNIAGSSNRYNFRRPSHSTGYPEVTTSSVDLQSYYHDRRVQVLQNYEDPRPRNYSAISVEEYQRRDGTHNVHLSRTRERIENQSPTTNVGVLTDSRGETDNAQTYVRGYETSLRSEQGYRISPNVQRQLEFQLNVNDNSNDKDLNIHQQKLITENIPVSSNNRYNNTLTNGQFLGDLDSLPVRNGPKDYRTKHLRKKWKYRKDELKEIEEKHRHKESNIVDTSGRRCVDRHPECVRWAAKCYKSSAVTLSCPMTCGKCGFHLVDDQAPLNSPEMENIAEIDNIQERAPKSKKKKKPARRELTAGERNARRRQRQLEREKNSPNRLMAHPGIQVIDQTQAPRRSKEERKRLKEQRRQERQRSTQARPDVCRDDPKHITSCKYWAKKGFCLDNRLIGDIYCRLSCNTCR